MAQVLLIDDDPQILRLYSQALEMEGHTVSVAPNGRVGMQVLAEKRFDVVVTDIIMPEKDGLELLMALHNVPNRPKILAITGGSLSINQSFLLSSAKILKADMVLPKPLGLHELSDAVSQLLEA